MSKIVDFYYSMAQTVYPIIRQYDPTAKIVLFGGLNLYSGSEQHLTFDEDFAKQLANMNIEQYGDAISIHAYPVEILKRNLGFGIATVKRLNTTMGFSQISLLNSGLLKRGKQPKMEKRGKRSTWLVLWSISAGKFQGYFGTRF